ncbi:peptide synthetase [Micropruina sonneratiae]|uniref:peptide synthetase n=1 Tax=Micropruina sonneratiae TaxID=2986940 RepID=UPI00222614F5|nr:peptide synthetase [Micropruina sp. KQZ13P-5]MCW3158717.1 peptide synthetase [Micropruina sp. KQZ13P-5]
MRLTNVARMALPNGRLMSYDVWAAGLPGRRLPVSFDQGRHVGQGQRPGSWMAIAARLPAAAGPDAVGAAWRVVLRRHGTFRSVFSRDADGALQLNEVTLGFGGWREHPVPPGGDPRDALRGIFDAACAPFERPSHALVLIVPEPDADDPRPVVVLGSDHSHVDMWSFLNVLRDLYAALGNLRAGHEVDHELPPVADFASHSAALAAAPPAPERVTRRWAEILDAGGGFLPRFPLPLGDVHPGLDACIDVRDLLDAAQTDRLAELAGERGVRLLPLAISVLTGVTAELAGSPLRAVFPVHSRHEERWRDSVGWFITNAVIESADTDPAACARAVAEAVSLGSYPLAPILAPYGGMPVAPGMFALSWLDVRRLPALPPDAQAQFVSAILADDGVMVWFVVNDEGLHLRARYPDTPQARTGVGAWLDAVEAALHRLLA